MIPLDSLVAQVATALSGASNAAREEYAQHIEGLAATPSPLPGSPTRMQTTHLKPLIPADTEWEGDLYVGLKDDVVVAQFAPDRAPRRRGKGIARLSVKHRVGEPPEAVCRIRDSADLQLDERLAASVLTPAKPKTEGAEAALKPVIADAEQIAKAVHTIGDMLHDVLSYIEHKGGSDGQ